MEHMTIDAKLLCNMFLHGTYELNKNKDIVDALNVFPVPDGDTGTNMSLTMNSAVDKLKSTQVKTVEEVAKMVSKGSLMGARGNSGVILSQIFRGFAKGCKGKETLNSLELCLAFKEAADTAYSAVLKPVEGTILTVIRKIAEKANDYIEEEVPIDELLKVLITRGEETLESTPDYLDVLKQAGVVDAGGKGLLCIIEGFYKGFMGEAIPKETSAETEGNAPAQSFMATEDIKFTYCTEFIIEGKNIKGETLKETIFNLGDSMVFVQDEDLVKVHVHTNNPGVALEEALKWGELKKVKIENMRDQHHHIIDNSMEGSVVSESVEATKASSEKAVEQVEHDSEYGFIAVSMGDGFTEVFNDLGIHGVITGGQTMNPSTEDFLKEIDKCPSDHIVLFPNNSNIIMAANQAKSLSDKDVHVVPSKTMAQCITAFLAFSPDEPVGRNVEAMTDSLSDVGTIQVTYAVRDTTFNGLEIEKDDYLAVADGVIKSVGKEQMAVILEAVEKTMNEESEILSIYYGSDVDENLANEVAEAISERFDELEIEIYRGGQPLYYYIIGIE